MTASSFQTPAIIMATTTTDDTYTHQSVQLLWEYIFLQNLKFKHTFMLLESKVNSK